MGINSLLRTLKEITKRRHIKHYSGMKMGIDGHCWLHKSLIFAGSVVLNFYPESDLEELLESGLENNQLFIRKVVQFMDTQIRRIKKFNITPILIFDGSKPSIKHNETKRRSDYRKSVKHYIKNLLKTNIKKAKLKFIESCSVTQNIVEEVCYHLIKMNVEYIISPYESDPQLAYLQRTKYIDIIYSEDSDLLVYGCPLVIFKLDKNGMCDELRINNVNTLEEFKHWNFKMFREFCVLSGCDYFKMKGMGSRTAYKIINKHGSFDNFVEACLNYWESERAMYPQFSTAGNLVCKFEVDEVVVERFKMALYTFDAQVVLDPITNKYSNLNNLNGRVYK